MSVRIQAEFSGEDLRRIEEILQEKSCSKAKAVEHYVAELRERCDRLEKDLKESPPGAPSEHECKDALENLRKMYEEDLSSFEEEVKERDAVIFGLRSEVEEKDAELSALRSEIGTKDGELEAENVRLAQELAGFKERVLELEEEKRAHEEEVSSQNEQLERYRGLLEAAKENLEAAPKQLQPTKKPGEKTKKELAREEWIDEVYTHYPFMISSSMTVEEARWLDDHVDEWMKEYPVATLKRLSYEEENKLMVELWSEGKHQEEDPGPCHYHDDTWEVHRGPAHEE